MKVKQTPIAAAVTIALLSAAAAAHAQNASPQAAAAPAAAASDAAQLDTVIVTGIRASQEKAMAVKRSADTHIEVITAEDIGKMPDKNIADSLSRVPGVTVSSAGANEGGFAENDRVSMRGTGPSLTQTLINGHNVASGDWFVLNQTSTVGRSVSYTLLPSELVSQVVVHKTSEASLVEGGVAGSVDIITRKPLEFSKPFTANVSVGAAYSDLSGKTDPQFNALFNWRNAEHTGGVMFQVFDEKSNLRRDGQEILGYDQITIGGVSNVYAPHLIGSTYFTQTRERKGGLLDGEIKPTADLTLEAQAFYSHLDASNYNNNYMIWGPGQVGTGNISSYTTSTLNGVTTLTSATYAPTAGVSNGVYDEISRPGESASTSYYTLEAKYTPTDRLTLNAQAGTSYGTGKTPRQDVAEWNTGAGTGGSFQLNGVGAPASWNLGTSNASSPATSNATFGWIFGDQNVDVKDGEQWLKLDGDYALDDAGPWTDVKFGVRASNHSRSSWGVAGQGVVSAAPVPTSYQNYPTNWASGLGGGPFPTGVWYLTPAQVAAEDQQYAFDTLPVREDIDAEFGIRETTQAAYVQGNMAGKGWSGNIGLRLVRTTESVTNYELVPVGTPGSNTVSAFAWPNADVLVNTQHTYNDILPSYNFKLDLSPTQVLRFAASRTMTRPDYSSLAGTVTLSGAPNPAVAGATGSGSGGNPNLAPVVSDNFDVSWEYYYAPRAMVSISPFIMNLRSNVGYGSTIGYYTQASSYAGCTTGCYQPYNLTTFVNTTGAAQGIEFAWEQPIAKNFGVSANYTYTDAYENDPAQSNGTPMPGITRGPLVGASRNVANLSGYYEDDRFNVRVAYTYRSSFYSGLDRSSAYFQDATGTVSASLGYKINEQLSVSLDGLNLNNPELKYYSLNTQQPRAFYLNGRQYYLSLHAKF